MSDFTGALTSAFMGDFRGDFSGDGPMTPPHQQHVQSAAALAAAGSVTLIVPTPPMGGPGVRPPATSPATAPSAASRPLRAPNASEPPPRRPVPAADAVRVLVVDDEPSICKALTIALVREGYAVLAAHGGEAAHALLAAERVDVMVVDLRMPDLRGDVVYHLASALQPWLTKRTVFTTGDISERAEEIVRACGCPLLRKPFTLAEAIGAVRAVAPAEGATRTA